MSTQTTEGTRRPWPKEIRNLVRSGYFNWVPVERLAVEHRVPLSTVRRWVKGMDRV